MNLIEKTFFLCLVWTASPSLFAEHAVGSKPNATTRYIAYDQDSIKAFQNDPKVKKMIGDAQTLPADKALIRSGFVGGGKIDTDLVTQLRQMSVEGQYFAVLATVHTNPFNQVVTLVEAKKGNATEIQGNQDPVAIFKANSEIQSKIGNKAIGEPKVVEVKRGFVGGPGAVVSEVLVIQQVRGNHPAKPIETVIASVFINPARTVIAPVELVPVQ